MPQVSITELLAARPGQPLILDGGTGSVLEDRGVDVRTELWSSGALLTSEGREETRQLHADYVAAGADIVIANTHNLNPQSCRDGELLARLERVGVETAALAVPAEREVTIAAGIGSAEPWATSTARTEAEIVAWLEPCVAALRPTGALILFESLSTPPELAAVAALARDTDLTDFGIGLTCGPDGRTWGGVTMSRVAEIFADTSLSAAFVQCTRHDLARIALIRLVDALDGSGAVPGVYANDGRTWSDMCWHGERISPEAYAAEARTWRDAGARIVGGCCGTGPEHIAALAAALAD